MSMYSLSVDDVLTSVLRIAIAGAKRRRSAEVTPDDVMSAALLSIARFGIARVGSLDIDLEALGIDWRRPPEPGEHTMQATSYSAATLALLDEVTLLQKLDQAPQVRLAHLLAAFASGKPAGLMAKLAERDIDSGVWRAAVVTFDSSGAVARGSASAYLSPEQAAELLGVHHQTVRGYIRSGKLPAMKIAGERAVRIRREDLDRLLEPLQAAEPE